MKMKAFEPIPWTLTTSLRDPLVNGYTIYITISSTRPQQILVDRNEIRNTWTFIVSPIYTPMGYMHHKLYKTLWINISNPSLWKWSRNQINNNEFYKFFHARLNVILLGVDLNYYLINTCSQLLRWNKCYNQFNRWQGISLWCVRRAGYKWDKAWACSCSQYKICVLWLATIARST